MRKSGKRVLASSFLTEGWTMTSSPGTQLMGLSHVSIGLRFGWYGSDSRCDPVLVTSLERVEHAQDLGGVAAGGCWV
jgi:hypothetical protein